MAFKLYNAPQSTCSQRVRFVFNGKKITFDEVKLNLLAGDQLKPDYSSSIRMGWCPLSITMARSLSIRPSSPNISTKLRRRRVSRRNPRWRAPACAL